MIFINNKKLDTFSLTKNNYYVVLDFDQTLTAKDSQNSWEAIIHSGYLYPEHVKEHDNLENQYLPIERDDSLDFHDRISCMQTWYTKITQLFDKYTYKDDLFHNCVIHSFLKFRQGAIPFLTRLYQNHIPVVIISAGLGETIEEFLKLNCCYYPNIYVASNFITGKRKSNISNYISALNKDISCLPDAILNKISSKTYGLLFGDVIHDIRMVPKDKLNSTVCFGFLEKM